MYVEATAYWDEDAQKWALSDDTADDRDDMYCGECGEETTVKGARSKMTHTMTHASAVGDQGVIWVTDEGEHLTRETTTDVQLIHIIRFLKQVRKNANSAGWLQWKDRAQLDDKIRFFQAEAVNRGLAVWAI